MIMNKNIYLGLVLTACMSVVSAPLLAEILPAPEHPTNNITAAATSPEEHSESAKLEMQYAEHNKAMAEHFRSVALEYEKAGHKDLMTHYERMAEHHDALAKEHEKAAATHEKMAKPK
jgi:hypothetical protein